MVKTRHETNNIGEESGLAPVPSQADRSEDLADEDGIPTTLAVANWIELFDPAGPVDSRESRRLQAALRFCRPDGSAVFDTVGRSPQRLQALAAWSGRVGDPGLANVVSRWLPGRSAPALPPSPPPLGSDSRRDRVLAVLRPDWSPRGDLVAVDHRRIGDEALVEIAARGRTWVGPSWTSGEPVGKATLAKPTYWTSGTYADAIEWSYKIGPLRVTRCAVLLRGRSMALLGQQDDGRAGSAEIRLDLAGGVEAKLVEGSRAVALSTGPGGPSARLIPLGLPCHDRPTDLGSIAIEGRQVILRQAGQERRRWLSLLVCWGKAPTAWRSATVAYRSKACRGDVAVATRVAWGLRDEGIVVYRSLAEPALRSFLGHQTGARFLVGAFTRSGDVRPILKVDG